MYRHGLYLLLHEEVHYSSQPGSGANEDSKELILRTVKYLLAEQDPKYIQDSQQDAHELLVNMLCLLRVEGSVLVELNPGYISPVSHLEFMMASVLSCNSCRRQSSTNVPTATVARPQRGSSSTPSLVSYQRNRPSPTRTIAVLSRPWNVLSVLLDRTKTAPSTVQEEPVTSSGHYQLTGVISHLGGHMLSGHYISDVLGANGKWLHCNDSMVSVTSQASVLRSRAQSAYLLFFAYSCQLGGQLGGSSYFLGEVSLGSQLQ
ncbi:hypothetical protein DPEC_G00332480 [Dallia pectoralis]|uniref:Uncharacterized protein n=1 Tax=Dallia pectoralis TaxID=75939 RepID=A0ACC2F629_DALPE|nr:hypothetical protein DPEC_G00332480 [Dallia pectoralis]